jgi:hypothetical protein
MPRMRDILQRFRPTSAPGAASTGGVPADRTADMAAELRPVLAMLEATQATCRTIASDADLEAERIRSQAREQARTIRDEGPERAATERAEAASRVSRDGRTEAERRSEAARSTVDQLTGHARELLPEYVELVVAATGLR